MGRFGAVRGDRDPSDLDGLCHLGPAGAGDLRPGQKSKIDPRAKPKIGRGLSNRGSLWFLLEGLR